MQLIKTAISNGFKVGFAIPRRSVCQELKNRLKKIFSSNKVIAVYGGHHSVISGDIVCLTTHQLFRYEKYFDLLIMDEIDAFPFKGNDVLKRFFYRSIKGHYVLLTATPSDELLKAFSKKGKDILRLATRFHHHPLPVPETIFGSNIKLYYKLIIKMRAFLMNNKPVFIFVPTIDDSKKLALFLKIFFRKGTYVNSKRKDGQKIIDDFRKGTYRYLVTTAVLERGVTIKDLQVIVFHADHDIYDKSALIQIAGRAGRRKEAPEGEVVFYAKKNNEHIKSAIADIIANNEILQDMLQTYQN